VAVRIVLKPGIPYSHCKTYAQIYKLKVAINRSGAAIEELRLKNGK
jgi:hypothetical protein